MCHEPMRECAHADGQKPTPKPLKGEILKLPKHRSYLGAHAIDEDLHLDHVPIGSCALAEVAEALRLLRVLRRQHFDGQLLHSCMHVGVRAHVQG